MPGLFATLGSTATALNAQTTAINVTGNNIANVNNPNYSREKAVVSDLGSVPTPEGAQSTGITVKVQQDRNALLDAMVRQEASLTAGFTAQQSILSNAQASLGENITNSSSSATSSLTTTDSGLSAALDSFFNSFQQVAANPSDAGQKQSLIQQAGVLTDRFQAIDQNLSLVQANAGVQVTNGVSDVNRLLTQIAQLNGQIQGLEAGNPGSAVDLRDQREGALEQLAQLMPVASTEDSHGELAVTAAAAGGATISLVSQATVANAVSFSGGVVSAGGSALALPSGTLQGTLAASTGPVQTLRDNLNALASQMVSAVNSAYNPSNTANANFFLASGNTAGTIALDPHLTVGSFQAGRGAAGDNSIALAVANLANHAFATAGGDAIDGTFTQFYAGTVTNLGQALDTANTQVTDQTNVQTIVTNQRASASGVSIDEEMSSLMGYQRAYQASSEVLQVVSGLLDKLIQSVN